MEVEESGNRRPAADDGDSKLGFEIQGEGWIERVGSAARCGRDMLESCEKTIEKPAVILQQQIDPRREKGFRQRIEAQRIEQDVGGRRCLLALQLLERDIPCRSVADVFAQKEPT